MTRTAFAALAVLLVSGVASAQEPVRTQSLLAEPAVGAEMAPAARLFEIRNGRLWLDGRALPASSVPAGLDLSGIVWQLELVGSVTPAIAVDDEWYVLERERLVPYDSSAKANHPVYILGETVVEAGSAPVDRLESVVDEAYRRQLSDADRALYEKIQDERRLESEIARIARRARALLPGPDRNALETELRDRLGVLFDLKQEIRREELTRAESEIRALRAVLDERATMRDDVITHRYHELLGTRPLDR
ncbi:MAG: hypothetical protein AAF791_05730 [Bacteroidota bacterium]